MSKYETELSTLSKRQKEFLKVFEAVGGNVSIACTQANVRSRTTFYNWLKNEQFRCAIEDVNESYIDLAESQLRAAVTRGDMNAVFFLLKTKGKSRGYVEKVEQEVHVDGFTKLLENLD